MSDNNSIRVKGARVNNLKNVSVEIPRDKFVVITGLSGSGKSSLAFDTLYAEGQRRYVESLSSYARQFLGRMKKPECDFIEGLPPTIAIEQRSGNRNPRSTVGTQTEIYEYLKLLFARIGHTISPVSGKEVRKHSVDDVVSFMLSQPKGVRFTVLAPMPMRGGRNLEEQLRTSLKEGFTRIEYKANIIRIEDLLSDSKQLKELSKGDSHLRMVFGMVNDKDVDTVMTLLPKEAYYYWTEAQTKRAINSDEMCRKGLLHGLIGQAYGPVNVALKSAIEDAKADDVIFVGGSNYVVGEAMKKIENGKLKILS